MLDHVAVLSKLTPQQRLDSQRLSDFARASGRLSAALTEEEVVTAILEGAAPLVGASAGVVGLVRGELVEIVGEIGYPEGRIAPWQIVSGSRQSSDLRCDPDDGAGILRLGCGA